VFLPLPRLAGRGTILAILASLVAPSAIVSRAATTASSHMRLIAVAPALFTGPNAADLDFRREQGLSTDVTTIHQLKSEEAAGALVHDPATIPWPVVLSPSEHQEIDFRVLKVEPAYHAAAIQDYLAAHRDTFAGNYFDNAGGGRQNLLFTADVASRAVELQGLFPYPDRLVVKQATYTSKQLQSMYLQLSNDFSYLSTLGLTSVSLDVVNNAIVLSGPGGGNADAITTLESHYGDLPLELQPGKATGVATGWIGVLPTLPIRQ
jgi:hypothetical protein